MNSRCRRSSSSSQWQTSLETTAQIFSCSKLKTVTEISKNGQYLFREDERSWKKVKIGISPKFVEKITSMSCPELHNSFHAIRFNSFRLFSLLLKIDAGYTRRATWRSVIRQRAFVNWISAVELVVIEQHPSRNFFPRGETYICHGSRATIIVSDSNCTTMNEKLLSAAE